MNELAAQLPLEAWKDGSPHERAAHAAVERGHFRCIAGRDGRSLYLVRFWLSAPRLTTDGDFDSGSSLLLHFIARPDEDQALHDHPWPFTTTILVGSYIELRPRNDRAWLNGPHERDLRQSPRLAGETFDVKATQLHRISAVERPTWTLVRTGPRFREWGFHPPGKPWVAWREHLEATAAARAQAECQRHE